MFSKISFEYLPNAALSLVYIYGYLGLFIAFISGTVSLSIIASVVAFSIQYPDRYFNIIQMTKTYFENITAAEAEQLQDNNQIIISDCKQYYTYKGVHYDIAFPLFWCLTHTAGTGPHECDNCQDYGCLRGVFIMYCANCATEYKDTAVGYGAVYNGIEKCYSDVNLSAWYTYLKHRNIKYIGLPEERELCGFDDDDRYRYELVEFSNDDDALCICIQPDFVVNIPYDEVFVDNEEEEGEIVDNEEEEGEIVDDVEEEEEEGDTDVEEEEDVEVDVEGAEVDDM